MNENLCFKCGKKIENHGRKFCSRVCQTRFCSQQYYDKVKGTPEFKAKKKIYFDGWRARNREHFNSLLREKNKLRARVRRAERLKLGLCIKCGNARTDEHLNCAACRAQMKEYDRISREKRGNNV